MQAKDPLPRPKDFIPDLPDEVEQVLFKALAMEPEERYEDMAAFAAVLESLVVGLAVPAAPRDQVDAAAKALIEVAQNSERAGNAESALDAYRKALGICPPGSAQAAEIQQAVARLEQDAGVGGDVPIAPPIEAKTFDSITAAPPAAVAAPAKTNRIWWAVGGIVGLGLLAVIAVLAVRAFTQAGAGEEQQLPSAQEPVATATAAAVEIEEPTEAPPEEVEEQQLPSAQEPAATATAAPVEIEEPIEAPPAEEVEEAPTSKEVVDEWGAIVIEPGAEVKIGVSSALAGAYAVYGQDMLNGVDLAFENYGDLLGWEVISEGGDDGCEGAPAVTVAELFAADPDLLAVVGPMCSGSVVPASDIYAEYNVVMVTPSSTAVIVTARGYENLFRLIANDDLQAEVAVDFLMTELGLTTLGVIHDMSIYGEGVARAVSDKFEAAGGTVTAYEGLTRGEVDYSAVVFDVIAGEPEAVYFGGMDAEGALLVTQLRTAGYEGVFFGPDGIKSQPTFVEGTGGNAEGAYMTFGAVGGATGYEEFEAQFTEQFDAPVAYAPGSYDAAMIILQAAAAVGFVDGDGNLVIGRRALAEAIRATKYRGVSGYYEFTAAGDISTASMVVYQVIGGEFVEVWRSDPGE